MEQQITVTLHFAAAGESFAQALARLLRETRGGEAAAWLPRA